MLKSVVFASFDATWKLKFKTHFYHYILQNCFQQLNRSPSVSQKSFFLFWSPEKRVKLFLACEKNFWKCFLLQASAVCSWLVSTSSLIAFPIILLCVFFWKMFLLCNCVKAQLIQLKWKWTKKNRYHNDDDKNIHLFYNLYCFHIFGSNFPRTSIPVNLKTFFVFFRLLVKLIILFHILRNKKQFIQQALQQIQGITLKVNFNLCFIFFFFPFCSGKIKLVH